MYYNQSLISMFLFWLDSEACQMSTSIWVVFKKAESCQAKQITGWESSYDLLVIWNPTILLLPTKPYRSAYDIN